MFNSACRLLSLYLIVCLLMIGGYTFKVGQHHGWNLIPVFFDAIQNLNWQGQFNVDFMGFLGLSALWVMWRNRFTSSACALGLVAFLGGMLFLAAYLLVLACRHQGDIQHILLGSQHQRCKPT